MIVGRRDAEHAANGTGTQASFLGNGSAFDPHAGKLAADDRPAPFNDNPTAPSSNTAAGAGATRAPLGGLRPERDFNAETSPYRQVFRDAGKDPDVMVSRPIAEQNRVIADHVKSTFGFKCRATIKVRTSDNQDEKRGGWANLHGSISGFSA